MCFNKRLKFDIHKKYSDGICTGDFVVSANKIVRGSMDFCLFGEMTVAMIVNYSYDVPILIICLLRYSSLSLLPSLSLPLMCLCP